MGSPLSKGTINAKYFDCDSDKSCKRKLKIRVACLKDKYLCKKDSTQSVAVLTPLRQTISSPIVIRIKSTYKVVCFGVCLRDRVEENRPTYYFHFSCSIALSLWIHMRLRVKLVECTSKGRGIGKLRKTLFFSLFPSFFLACASN